MSKNSMMNEWQMKFNCSKCCWFTGNTAQKTTTSVKILYILCKVTYAQYPIAISSQSAFACSKLTIETLEQTCEICSKLTIKTSKRRQCQWRQWRRFGVFIVKFDHISHLCSSVSIINFEHVIAGWDSSFNHKISTCYIEIMEFPVVTMLFGISVPIGDFQKR